MRVHDGEGDCDVGAVLAEENSRDCELSHRHALVVAACIGARQGIIKDAQGNVIFPDCVVVHGAGCPEHSTAALACCQSCRVEMMKHEGQDVVQLVESAGGFHEADCAIKGAQQGEKDQNASKSPPMLPV